MKQEVTIFCPATVSNVGPGFDLLGFALEAPGDRLTVRRNTVGALRIINESGVPLPGDPSENVAAIATEAMLEDLHASGGFDLVFTEKIPPGSGIGSSAASCVAAVMGINELLGAPLSPEAMLPFAMTGEEHASGSYHADNIAPALLGGMTLIRGYDPLEIKHIPYPDDLWCALVHPELEFKTSEGRKILPTEVPLNDALTQAGNLAGLVAGLMSSDYGLISRSIRDVFAEPYRVKNLPHFDDLKQRVLDEGALGTGLSGSGPSIFALCRGENISRTVAAIMQNHFEQHGIASQFYVSRISQAGCRLVNSS